MKVKARFDGEFFQNAGPRRRNRLIRLGRVDFLKEGYESMSAPAERFGHVFAAPYLIFRLRAKNHYRKLREQKAAQ